MSAFREYVLRIVMVAMFCALLSVLCSGSRQKELLKVLQGLVLAFVVIQPISSLDWDALPSLSGSFFHTGETFAQAGEDEARKAAADIIKAEVRAYILDKAAALNASLTVELRLSEENLPDLVLLSGSISPYARQQLETILETELGIPKENQQWSG